MKEYISFEAYENGKATTWYMDCKNLSLTELVNLRKALLGEKNAIPVIDRVINQHIRYHINPARERKLSKKELKNKRRYK